MNRVEALPERCGSAFHHEIMLLGEGRFGYDGEAARGSCYRRRGSDDMGNIRTALFGSTAALPLLGLSLIFAWVYAPLHVGEQFYFFHHLGFGCTLVALALIVSLRPCLAGQRALRVASVLATCAMGLAPLALFVPGSANAATIVIGGLLSGAGAAWVLGRWFCLYCRFRTELAVNYTLAAFSLSSCIRFALVPLSELSSFAMLAVLCVLPFCSLVLANRSERIAPGALALRKSYDVTGPASEKPPFSGTAGFFVEIVIYGLVFGVLRNGISDWSNASASLYVGHLFRIFMPLLLLAWINVPQNDERKERGLRAALLGCAFVVTVGIFFGDSPTVVISSLTLAARNFVTILLYMMLYRTVRDCEGHPLVVYGIGRGVYELALTVGLLLFSVTDVSDLIASMPITTFYFVMTCVLLLLLNSFSRIAAVIRRTPPPTAVAALHDSSPDERFASVAARFALSEREVEVMRLLCRGRTKRYIAETLYLSEDTVRWHAKQLYRKLDVHSKQELIDLVGIE